MTVGDARKWLTIALFIACLVSILVLKRRCGAAVGDMMRALEAPGASGVTDGGAGHRRDGF
jgi:hypothetical protein